VDSVLSLGVAVDAGRKKNFAALKPFFTNLDDLAAGEFVGSVPFVFVFAVVGSLDLCVEVLADMTELYFYFLRLV